MIGLLFLLFFIVGEGYVVCDDCSCYIGSVCSVSGWWFDMLVKGCQCNVILMHEINNAMLGISKELGCWHGGRKGKSGVTHG